MKIIEYQYSSDEQKHVALTSDVIMENDINITISATNIYNILNEIEDLFTLDEDRMVIVGYCNHDTLNIVRYKLNEVATVAELQKILASFIVETSCTTIIKYFIQPDMDEITFTEEIQMVQVYFEPCLKALFCKNGGTCIITSHGLSTKYINEGNVLA